jgi:type I restriction enzyme S subunit
MRGQWQRTQIGKLFRLINGFGFKPSDWKDEGTPIIRIQNLNDAMSDFNYYQGKIDSRYLVHKGDILFAWSGTKGVSFGARIWKGPEAWLNQHIFRVEPIGDFINTDFAYYLLKDVQSKVEAKAHGFKSTFVHVKKSDVEKTTVSLPPLPEQRKIQKDQPKEKGNTFS